ncbi:MAG: sigma-70 family RNA polymerase sigma factor [Gemmataceae bacterium]
MLPMDTRTEVERLLARIHENVDADQARTRLVELTYGGLTEKAIYQLAHERRLKRLHEPEDVVHRVMERLKKVLETRRVETVEELVRLANSNLRWVIGDLARQIPGREVSGLDGIDREDDRDRGTEADILEDRAKLHQKAAFLPGRSGQVFRLRYYDRLSVAEIAEQLGVSVRTVQDDWKESLNQISLELTGQPFQGKAPKHLGGELSVGAEGQ